MRFKLLNVYESNVEALILLIRAINVRVTETTINETLQNHPDYPSLLSISDALQQWNIDNMAVNADKDKIDELDTPFLAHVREPKKESLVLVTKIDEKSIHYRTSIYQKHDTVSSKESFSKKWTGIALLATPNGWSGEKHFARQKRREFLQTINIIALAGLIFLTSAIAIIKLTANKLSSSIIAGFSLLLLIKIAGVIITTLLLWYEIDKMNPALQKICTGMAKTNCNTILTSRHAKLFNWISWSEIGFIYFAGGFISLILAGNSEPAIIQTIVWLNVLALPYTLFSVYYQWRVAKQWCVLCLAIQVLLITEFLIAYGFKLFVIADSTSYIDYLQIFISFLSSFMGWFLIKPALLKLQAGKKNGRDLSRFKSDKEIFTALMEKQKAISHSPEGLGIVLGNLAAANILIKVCSPYCGPCAHAHREIEELLENHSNLKVQIIFNATNHKNDKASPVAKHLLAIDGKGDRSLTERALNDWYLNPEKNYARFAAQYPMNGEVNDQAQRIEAMDKWCQAMDIQFTPTFFFNGYQLQGVYSITDLNYFLSQ